MVFLMVNRLTKHGEKGGLLTSNTITGAFIPLNTYVVHLEARQNGEPHK